MRETSVNTSPNKADIRALLRADHEQTLRQLCDLRNARSAVERRALLTRLQPALFAHSRAEERAVYEPLIDRRSSDDPPTAGAEGLVDHDLVDTLLTELAQSRRADGAEWIAAATVLQELLEAHIADEHDAMFVALGQRFSGEELRAMGSRFLAAKQKLLAAEAPHLHWQTLPPPIAPYALASPAPGGE
jgi:hypothetical protein